MLKKRNDILEFLSSLRQDNYIQDEEKKIFKVSGVDCFECKIKTTSNNKWYEVYTFYPIALTEEWMPNLGFKKNSDDLWCIKWMKGFINPNSIFCLANYTENHLNIKYVHQLQNLAYSLTGQELTLSEKATV